MIVIAPNGGFGNRIRAIRSACYLADKLGTEIAHVWIGTAHICAFPHIQAIHDRSFEYFFHGPMRPYKATIVDTCYSEWLPGYYWYPFQNYGQRLLNVQHVRPQSDLPKAGSFVIETSQAFIPMTPEESYKIYSKYCIPNERFTSQLDPVPSHTVGISIRRNADFLQYFPGSPNLEPFVRSLSCPVILFSDDKEFQNEIRRHIRNPVRLGFEDGDRKSEDLAFLEFLTLARCARIYGTKDSSFAFEAALFGSVPYNEV